MRLFTARFSPQVGWDNALDSSFDSSQTLLIVFGGSDSALLASGFADLRNAFPQSHWIGCSTAGEIYDVTLADNTLSVAVMRFAQTPLRTATYKIEHAEDSASAGEYLAQQLIAPNLKSVFVICDGLTVNGSELTKGLARNLPANVIVTGGLAGDGTRFQATWVVANQQPQPQHVVAVGFYGDHVGVTYGSRGGWDVLGAEREVTHAEGNVLYTLDGQPALALYKKYLGERANELPAAGLLFPLAIRNELEEDGLTVRTILSVNEDDNSITFAGDIPQGRFVRLMRANFERLIDGAAEAAEDMAFERYQSGAMLTVAISCVGRRLVLAQRTEEEIESVQEALPSGSKLIGFYSYGELSPLQSGRCDLHNQTMTLTSLWENE